MPTCGICNHTFSFRRFKHHYCRPDVAPARSADRADSPVRDRSASPPPRGEIKEDPVIFDDIPDSPLDLEIAPPAPLPPPVNAPKFSIPADIPRALFSFIITIKLWSVVFNISAKAVTALLLILSSFIPAFPKLSLYQINRRCHLDDGRFLSLVVCTQCSLLYPLADCIDTTIDPGTGKPRNTARLCSGVKWPLHPMAAHRKQCNSPLIEKKGSKWVPLQQFHHTSLIARLGELLQR
jgi:hypothetical protein